MYQEYAELQKQFDQYKDSQKVEMKESLKSKRFLRISFF